MNRLLQVVALAIVALLAVPSSLAEGICQMLQPGPQVAMLDCCVSMGQTGMDHVPAAQQAPVSLQAQGCANNCCSISPQTPPFQNAPEKARLDSTSVAYVAAAVCDPMHQTRAILASAPVGSSPTPRHILLKTLRI